jgi:hypothetical protein
MANAGIGNPLGAVPIFDFGVPKTITGYASNIISGGAFVFASGAAGVISSGADTFVTSDLLFSSPASGGQFTGIAMHTAASGAPITVALDGVFIVGTNGTIVAGTEVGTDGQNCVCPLGSKTMTAYSQIETIGRALTAGASGTAAYVLLHVQG